MTCDDSGNDDVLVELESGTLLDELGQHGGIGAITLL